MSVINDNASNASTAKQDNKSLGLGSKNNGQTNSLDSIIKKDKPVDTKKVEWSPENEEIMVEWCDVAQCYKWLNTRAHIKYAFMNAWFTIPAITLSTISGTASFAQASIPEQYQPYAPMVIGTINILIGILTTVQQYLKIAELNEAHRVASIAWDKFARNIRIELAKKPKERMDAGSFIKLSRQEFDRLMETSPNIDLKILRLFDNTFKGKEGSPEREIYDALKKPDICNSIKTSNHIRHKWYLNMDKTDEDYDIENNIDLSIDDEAIRLKDELIKAQQKQLEQTLEEIKRKEQETMMMTIKQSNELILLKQTEEQTIKAAEEYYRMKSLQIDEYIYKFKLTYNRSPDNDEIRNGLRDTFEDEVLERYLKSYTDNNV